MKVNQKLHQAKLAKWVALLQNQASLSGLSAGEGGVRESKACHKHNKCDKDECPAPDPKITQR